jgi:hypothetical protein
VKSSSLFANNKNIIDDGEAKYENLLIQFLSKPNYSSRTFKLFPFSYPASLSLRENISGCWEVVASTGQPNWTKYSNVFGSSFQKVTGTKNRNFQYFSRNSCSFVNLSEYFGPIFFAMTEGTFALSTQPTPGDDPAAEVLLAKVGAVVVVAGGVRLRLPVRGSGEVRVRYRDPGQRVLLNEDGAAVLQLLLPTPPAPYLAIMNDY